MTTPVTLIGAGWAGLAAAVTLCHQGIPVQVFEAAKTIGGRGRNVQYDDQAIDNGQHLMIGAYRELLGLMQLIGARENELFTRLPQHLKIINVNSAAIDFELKLPRLMAPLHLLSGMLKSKPLTPKDKLRSLLRFNKLLITPLEDDCSVAQWLEQAGLPDMYVERLLKPLCLAALTTHPHEASAKIFQTVLLQTFQGSRANTDLLIARKNISEIFPQQARAFIEAHGGKIFTEQRVRQLHIENQHVTGISVDGQHHPVDQLILAASPVASERLLSEHPACADICHNIRQFEYEPIITLYLKYPDSMQLPELMLGLRGASAEWLFDRRACDQPGLIAGVISASGPHHALSHDQLAQHLGAELSKLFGWPTPQRHWVIEEKRAALRCVPNIDKIRPGIQTPIANLRLCGDYVLNEPKQQAGLPSTLEAALRCGVKCARQLIKELN